MKRYSLLLGALLALPTHAFSVDGNDLLRRINAVDINGKGNRIEAYMDSAYAQGYITALQDASYGFFQCMPRNVMLGQLTEMARNHLMQNPTIRHLPADEIVIKLWAQTWPCPKKTLR